MSVAAFTLGCMATFAVTMVHGPHWDRSRPIRGQDGWNEHAAFMDGLVDDGLIILGGPLGDGQQGALLLAEAAGEREIAAQLGEDPWAAMELLHVGTVQSWALWLDSRSRARPS